MTTLASVRRITRLCNEIALNVEKETIVVVFESAEGDEVLVGLGTLLIV